MRIKATLIQAAAMTVALPGLLILSACSSSDGDGNNQPPTATTFAQRQINTSTDENSAPVQLNDLPLSDSDTTETGRPQAL